MNTQIGPEIIASFRQKLENHPVYEAVSSIEDLRIFMQHHVYSVWDFMSLIKYLQFQIAPTQYPWYAQGDGSIRRFINELVLEEESDETHIAGEYSSHFELYQKAMQEVGAEIRTSSDFVKLAHQQGIAHAFQVADIPTASKAFTSVTFEFIQKDKAHQVAAALALGREHIIPAMFRAILKKIKVDETQAPIFHFYLNRHIHLDEDFHAPLSLRLLNSLCMNDPKKIAEAIDAANLAVNARLKFWDGVLLALESK